MDSFTPSGLITVSYGANVEATLGNKLTPGQTQTRPEVHATLSPTDSGNELAKLSSSDSYTLVVTDPDAPSRTDKTYSEYLHYLVTGIKLDFGPEGFAAPLDFDSAKEVLKYEGPGPPPKTGWHRYVFILFKETKGAPTYEGDGRMRFGTDTPGTGVRPWAKKNGLEPVAINFFYAQNDEQ